MMAITKKWTGTPGNDNWVAPDNSNWIADARQGNDNVTTKDGNDYLYGGDGSDILNGGKGNDFLDGDGYYENLPPDVRGEVEFVLNGSIQKIAGTLAEITSALDIIAIVNLNDATINSNGVISNLGVTLNGKSTFDDYIVGGSGNDTLFGGIGNDKLFGDFEVNTYLGRTSGTSTNAAYNTYYSYKDVLYGGNGSDTLDGGLARDSLYGENGDDFLYGGAGNDTLFGGDGDDYLHGDLPTITGAKLIDGGLSTAISTNYQSYDDVLQGGTGDDSLYGGIGNDSLDGGEGDDTLSDFSGSSTLDGGAGYDILTGGTGNDKLYGGADDDELNGSSGDDTLYGGLGDDTLTGGSGSDKYVFDTTDDIDGSDEITDFTHTDDSIRLDNAIFTALPNGALSSSRFKLYEPTDSNDNIIYDPGTGEVSYDADGIGNIDAVLIVTLGNAPTNVNYTDFYVI